MEEELLLSYLRNGYLASRRDTTYIRSFLDESSHQLSGIEREMNAKFAQLEQLEQQLLNLQAECEPYKGLIHPIRRLPRSALQLIFLYSLPIHSNSYVGYTDSPLRLTHTCSRWREVAINTPSLWTSIYFRTPEFMIYDECSEIPWHVYFRRKAEMVTHWLDHSGDCTLHISLWITTVLEEAGHGLNIILDALMPSTKRWGTLHLNAADGSLDRIASLPLTALPRLHTLTVPSELHLFTPYDMQIKVANWATSGPVSAPRLTKVSYGGKREDFGQFRLNCSQLTSVTLHGAKDFVSFWHLNQFLLRCPLLWDLGLDISGHQIDPKNNLEMPRIVPLIHLESLCLRVSDPCHYDAHVVFDRLFLPSLKTLELDCRGISSILMILGQVPLGLETLIIDPFIYSEKHSFLDSIRPFTTLKNLILKRSMYGARPDNTALLGQPRLENAFLSFFITQSDNIERPLFPSLASFTCLVRSAFSDQAILDFVNHGQDTLKKISITQNTKHHQPTMQMKGEMFSQQGIIFEVLAPSDFMHDTTGFRYPANMGIERRQGRNKGLPLF